MIQTLIIKNPYTREYNSGATETQISVLTTKVSRLSEHLKIHTKDYSSRKGLRKALATRKKLLAYLFREDISRYQKILNLLGIRSIKR
ncbi:unnamed protein product [Sphagnum tenellum]|uniref:Small ribosomal subunit protein uS15c n=1 Tax=Cylindrocystis brebissonii TaxID=102167 RepID=A0A191T671_9VIRI|nr:ribosomal protein S15 [Cylindrocystis brebissonii]ANI25893.1 ribosomal protein S15 [Cylindrocystis brebissonii]